MTDTPDPGKGPLEPRTFPNPQGRSASVGAVWIILVAGLVFVVLLGAILAFALISGGKDAGPFVTLATAALTGLLGLFVASPAGKG